MDVLRIVYISVQSADARTMEVPVMEACRDLGVEADLYCVNADDVDDDPLTYHELVRRSKAADLVMMRCMTDPTRMMRFVSFEEVLKECPGYVLIFSGNMDVRLAYRDLFKGDDQDFILLGEYMRNRGADNDRNAVIWLHNRLSGISGAPEPVALRRDGIHHPDFPNDVTQEEYMRHLDPNRPTIGVLYTSNMWIYDNQAHVHHLIRRLEQEGLNVIPVFFGTTTSNVPGEEGTVAVVRKYFTRDGEVLIDALIMHTPFSQLNNSREGVSGIRTPDEQNFYRNLIDVPVIQAMTVNKHFADYEESASGISKYDLKSSVFWPEIDGQIIAVPICSVEGARGEARKFSPLVDRIDHLVRMVRMWAVLKHIPKSERKVAILIYQSRPESGRIGNAAGLDTIESVSDMLKRFGSDGYTLDHVPENGRALIDEILDNITNDLEWSSPERIREKAAYLMSRQEYDGYYSKLSDFNRRQIEDSWGKPPGEIAVEGGKFVIPGIVNGNIFIGYQPLRGWAEQMESVYHDPVVPMTHQYLAFYRWLKNDFKADVVMHIGTHGTLEWLPGKSVGLSGKCYPDLVLDGIPHIYPYIIDDPGEGIQCKRRSEAVLIGHMCPTMSRAGSYGELSQVEGALQEYLKARSEIRGGKRTSMVQGVLDAARAADLLKDLHLPDDIDAEGFETHVEELHDYLTDVRDAIIRDGLHILGRAPEGDRLEESVYSLMRLRNGEIPSFRDAVGSAMGYDTRYLAENPSENTKGELNGILLDRIDACTRELIHEMAENGFESTPCREIVSSRLGEPSGDLSVSLDYICTTLVPNLLHMTDEIDNLMHGCDGRYVLPGPSGAPTRGNAHILPMGRNYYSIDPDIIPLRSSWEIGRKMADEMISKYMDEKGCYPREVGFIIWATDTMKTNGDDVAYILWLMGVKPQWSPSGGQVCGLEVVPIEELGRPRIDVTVRITGLFRDAFPNLIDLIDDAVKLVANLDESDEENYLASNLRNDIVEAMASGIAVDEARMQNSVRIFGCPPGMYGPGVNHAIETGDWQTVEDLADIYLEWSSYAYGRGIEAVSMKEQFKKRLSKVGVTVKNMPDREIDMLDMDDVYGYLGGMNSFVRAYGNKDALTFMGDSSDPERTRIRSTKDELQFVYRSKILNPKFVEGLMQHGYRGVSEIANLTEFTFGWDATSDIVDDWVYESLAERYLFDDNVRDWMEDENPHAAMDMLNRLMEAIDRGMWDVKPETLEKLKDIYLELEERIEEVNDR
jgi:cobaltochelatase CobN